MTEVELADVLRTVAFARLATRNLDGSSQIAPVWFEYDDGTILLGTQACTREVMNVARDGDVTVLIDKPFMPCRGLMIRGTARLDTPDLVAMRAAAFDRFMPREEAQDMAESLANGWDPVVIRVIPTEIAAWDPAEPAVNG